MNYLQGVGMKKMLRSIIARVLVMVLLFSAMSYHLEHQITAQSGLTDIQNHWGKPYIQRLVDSKAISGYPDGTFKPNGTISKAAFIAVLAKAMKLPENENNYFEDTEGHWAQSYISAAVDAGLVELTDIPSYYSSYLLGYKFKPDDKITREELAQISVRALGEEYSALLNIVPKFSDSSQISKKLVGYVTVAGNNGIISGYANGKFAPKAYATRAEACVIITKLLDKLDEKPKLTEMDGEDIYNKYSKSVVLVTGYLQDGTPLQMGSGIVIDKSGKVLTNHHVINATKSLTVTFNDGTVKKVVSVANYNRTQDFAVLNIESGTYVPATIGNSRRLNVGEKAYTIGHPLGLNLTMGDGLVSSFIDLEGLNYIQFSAPISPGSSGGGLIDKYGNLVGITTSSIWQGQNINMAIPICDIMNQIIGKDEKIDLFVATNPTITITDAAINVHGLNLKIFGTNDSDMEKVTYDATFYMKDKKDMGFTLDYDHEPNIKDNELTIRVKIVDDFDEVVDAYYLTQVISKGTHTTNKYLLDEGELEYLGEGVYTLEYYVNNVKITAKKFYVYDDKTDVDYGLNTTRFEILDGDALAASNGDVVNRTSIFSSGSTKYIGFNIEGTFANTLTKYTAMLLTVEIKNTAGFEKKLYATVYALKNDADFSFIYWHGGIPGYYPVGNYTATLLYKGKVLNQAQFQVVNTNDANIYPQTIEGVMYKSAFSNKYFMIPEIQDMYYVNVPIKVGNVSKETHIITTYKLKDSNGETREGYAPVNFDYYLSPTDSNKTIDVLIGPILLNEQEKEDYLNGSKLELDVIVNDQIIGTIPYEPSCPNVSYSLKDAFIIASSYNDYDTQRHYETKYESFKKLEKSTISLSGQKSLFVDYHVAASVYKDAILIDFIHIDLVEDATGKTVYSAEKNYHSINEKTANEVINLTSAINDGTIKPGTYTLNVYTEKGAKVAFSKQYTFVQ